jgi:hypothetical protein
MYINKVLDECLCLSYFFFFLKLGQLCVFFSLFVLTTDLKLPPSFLFVIVIIDENISSNEYSRRKHTKTLNMVNIRAFFFFKKKNRSTQMYFSITQKYLGV